MQVANDACWALSYVTDGSTDRIQAVMDAGAVPRVVELLGSNEIACVVSVGVHALQSICILFLHRLVPSLRSPLPSSFLPDPSTAYNRERCDR